MAKVACVILNYNNSELTLQLIRKIEPYYEINYVIIVDNNSSDNSELMFEELQREHSKIRLLLLDTNMGYAKGNNIGAEYAINELHCDYVLIANPDVIFPKEYIPTVLRLFDLDDRILVASAIARDSNNKISYCCYWSLPLFWDYMRKFVTPLERSYQKKQLKKQQMVKKEYIITEAVSGACFIADKRVFTEIGGFDENTFLYCEESILGGKVKKRGYFEAVSYESYYNHNHQYKTESFEHKIKHYKIMIQSRKYYLDCVLKINAIQKLLYSFASIVSIEARKIMWRLFK